MIRKCCWDAVGACATVRHAGGRGSVDAAGRAVRPGVRGRPLDHRPGTAGRKIIPEPYSGWSWSRLRLAHELYGTNYARALRHARPERTQQARLVSHARERRDRALARVRHREAQADMLRTSDEVASRYEYRITRGSAPHAGVTRPLSRLKARRSRRRLQLLPSSTMASASTAISR